MQIASSLVVVGSTGQLARAMGALANERQLSVVAVGRPQLDLTDTASIERVINARAPHAIVNAAAYTLVDKAESEADVAFRINRDGPAHLARVAAQLNVPFVHVSTDYVFDGNKATPYDEADSPSPLSIYGRSKREGEIAVLDSNPAAVVLRTSWLYSPYGQNFVKTMLRLAATRERVRVVDDQSGAPTSARDLAKAINKIVEQIQDSTEDRGGIYHLAAAGETTWYGFAKTIFAEWEKRGRKVPTLQPIRTAEYVTPARRPANSRLDCSKIASVFGIRLPPWPRSLEICLDELIAGELGDLPC